MSLPRLPAALAAALVVAATALAPATSAHARAADGSVQVGSSAVPAADTASRSALTVHLVELSPTIPQKGNVRMVGTVTNDSDQTWREVNVLPFVSRTPITTREELAEAAGSEATSEVGDRILTPGLFVTVGDLEPGQTRSFRLALPRDELNITGAPGVYWIGAHALGTDTEGRDDVADGRARTFIPLVPPKSGRTSVAVALPVRQQVLRDTTGKVLDPDEWNDRLAPGGRLGRILGLGQGAAGLPFTWLVDPAVLQAATDLAAGNPGLSLGQPRAEEGATGTPSPNSSGSDEGDESDGSDGGDGSGEGDDEAPDPAAATAQAWLDGLLESARGQATLGLPYADPDVASLARLRPALLSQAEALGARTFADNDLDVAQAVAPPDTGLGPAVTEALADLALVLLPDGGHPRARTQWTVPGGATLVRTDSLAAAGGPAPTDPLDALAVRQRILADAALRALDGIRSPMPVVLPADWDPGRGWQRAQFFESLDQPWLSLVALSPVNTADGQPAPPELALAAPTPEQVRRQVHPRSVRAALDLIDTGLTYRQLLDTDNDLRNRLLGAALGATSYAARADDLDGRMAVNALDAQLTSRLGAVQVLGTDFVTLSGSSGQLTVSLLNGLDVPVVVGLRASGDSGVRLDAPDPARIGPGQRTAIRLTAHAQRIGVHDITLTPVTTGGRSLGTPLEFTLRTSQVGRLIWIVIVAGAVLLSVMMTRRIVQRVRNRRRA